MKFLRIVSQFSTFKTLLVACLLTAGYYVMYFDTGAVLQLEIQNLESQVAIEETKKKDTEATIKKEDEMQANLAALDVVCMTRGIFMGNLSLQPNKRRGEQLCFL